MSQKHAIPFSALLPQKSDALLSDPAQKSQILHVLKQLHIVMVEALNAFFIEGDLHLFDPHVGETCCQIRAYHLIRLFKNRHKFFQNKQACLNFITTLEAQRLWIHKQMIAEGDKQKSQRDRMTLAAFLQSVECDFEIPFMEIAYLCAALLLSQYSYFNEIGITAMNYKKLMCNWSMSKRLSHNIVRVCQRYIADFSCNFIVGLCDEAPGLLNLKAIMPMLQEKDDDGRSVMPYYFGAKTLVEHMKCTKQPILLLAERRTNKHIETLCLLFHFCDVVGEYKLVPTSIANPSDPCFVIHGITRYNHRKLYESRANYIARLESVGIEKLFLASMAGHVQFVGKKLHALRQVPMRKSKLKDSAYNSPYQEFVGMKKFADKSGCTLVNANLMVVRHVYCDILANQFELAELMHHTVQQAAQLKETVS